MMIFPQIRLQMDALRAVTQQLVPEERPQDNVIFMLKQSVSLHAQACGSTQGRLQQSLHRRACESNA
jgi:hypothetical protein